MGTTGLEIVTKLYRNNGDNTFTEQTNNSFTTEYDGSIAWGDYDNDGNLDILICGYTGNSYATKIYRNNGDNTFTDQTSIHLTNVSSGSVAWGDYDNDGDLDILMSGNTGSQRIVKVYKNNDNNSFTELAGNAFPTLDKSSVAWGDYDNDGDLDILLTGDNVSSGLAKIYQNNGNDSFIEDTNAFLPGVIDGGAIWGDYDNDGKLDILLTGAADYEYIAKIYKNNTSVSNSAPSEISNLQATSNSNSVVFKWNKATDGETPQNGLTYNLYIYENGQSIYKVSPQAFKQTDINNGSRIVAQIGGIRYNSNGYTINGLANGNYKWSVQAIDAGLKGGKFATEQSFTMGGTVSNLSVSAQTINIGANANSKATFAINSNISWQIISNQSWLTLSSSSGSNNATITLTAQVNSTKVIRTAIVTVSGNGVTAQNLTITQDSTAQLFTEQTGSSLIGVVNGRVVWGDLNNDGNLEALVTGAHSTKIYKYENNAFVEIYQGQLPTTNSGSCALGDYDNDGKLDVLLTGVGIPAKTKIFHNTGAGFSEVFIDQLAGVSFSSGNWGDFDNDGLMDILITGTSSADNKNITKLYKNNKTSFSEVFSNQLTGVTLSASAWGDYDNDGYIDFIIIGNYDNTTDIAKIYHNDQGMNFTEAYGGQIKATSMGSVDWGDYDNDGNLDILITGYSEGGRITRVYHNTKSGFVEAYKGQITGVSNGSGKWADYDNDGLTDILLTGVDANTVPVTKLFRNTGSGFVEDSINNVVGVRHGAAVWGDYDNDGDLDIFLTGITDADGETTKIYRNNAVKTNLSPLIPTKLSVTSKVAGGRNDVTFKWEQPTDTETGQNGLTYNFYIYEVGKTYYTRSSDAISQTQSLNGRRLVAQIGAIQYNSNGYTIKGMANGNYKWSVQAIDGGLKGGKFATEQSFMIGGIVPSLSVSTQTLNLNATNDSKASFDLTSNVNWTISANQNWLALSDTSGSGNTTITLTAQANPTKAERTATITVSGTGVTAQTITITQNGATSVMSMTSTNAIGSTITFSLQANIANTPIQIDFGDGILVNKIIGTSESTISGTLVGSQTVKIYGSGITYLSCYNSLLSALDVSDNSALTDLICSYNLLTSLDVTSNTALSYLHCGHNQLTTLDMTRNTALTVLKCYFNQFNALDVTQNGALKTLDCSSNQLASLDVSKNSALSFLYVSYNQFTTLDITRNTALTTLSCNNNQITVLDVSKNTALSFLDCKNNQLSTIDVSANSRLDMFYCTYNELIFSTLPLKQATWSIFSYAPQNSISIPKNLKIGDEVDLSNHLLVNGNTTVYKWKTKKGSTLVEGIDYTIANGKTTFLKGKTDSIYCEMTNTTFPDFTGANVFNTTCTSVKLNTAVEDQITSGIEIYAYQKTLYIHLPYNAQVSIFDLSGRLILSKTIDNGSTTIPMQNTGIYLIKITGNKEPVARKVFVE